MLNDRGSRLLFRVLSGGPASRSQHSDPSGPCPGDAVLAQWPPYVKAAAAADVADCEWFHATVLTYVIVYCTHVWRVCMLPSIDRRVSPSGIKFSLEYADGDTAKNVSYHYVHCG